MGILIDIIILAIIAVSAFFAHKKGFIGTIFSLLGTLVAIVLSIILCNPVSTVVDQQYVNPAVKSYIQTTVEKSLDEVIPEGGKFEYSINNMPTTIKSLLDVAGINIESAEQDVANTTSELVEKIASPISSTISRVVTMIGLFIILSIALWVVCKLLTAVFNALPIGKTLNKIGGLAFGIVRGLLIVFVVSLLFVAVSKGTDPESNSIFSKKTVESTYVLKTVNNINPLAKIIK